MPRELERLSSTAQSSPLFFKERVAPSSAGFESRRSDCMTYQKGYMLYAQCNLNLCTVIKAEEECLHLGILIVGVL